MHIFDQVDLRLLLMYNDCECIAVGIARRRIRPVRLHDLLWDLFTLRTVPPELDVPEAICSIPPPLHDQLALLADP